MDEKQMELLTLDPKTFNNLQDFFTKYKDLLWKLKDFRVDKSKEDKKWFSPFSPNMI
jgi:hypothetical protein